MTTAARRTLGLCLVLVFAVAAGRARDPRPAAAPPEACGRPVGVRGAVARPGVVCLGPGDGLAEALGGAGARCEAPAGEAPAAGDLLDVGGAGGRCELGRGRLPARALRALRVRVDPNHAGEDELRAVPGIGPALARRIVEDRAARGPFGSLDELARVRGIGPKTVEKLRPRLRLDDEP